MSGGASTGRKSSGNYELQAAGDSKPTTTVKTAATCSSGSKASTGRPSAWGSGPAASIWGSVSGRLSVGATTDVSKGNREDTEQDDPFCISQKETKKQRRRRKAQQLAQPDTSPPPVTAAKPPSCIDVIPDHITPPLLPSVSRAAALGVALAASAMQSGPALHTFFKKTRPGRVTKIVREVYLRDDVPCGFVNCSACVHATANKSTRTLCFEEALVPLFVVDYSAISEQLDFFCCRPSPIRNCVIPLTVLNKLRRENPHGYARIRNCISTDDDTDGVTDVPNASHSPVPSRSFYVFPNCFSRDTYVTRVSGESLDDFEDRAVYKVVNWYRIHIAEGTSGVYALNDTFLEDSSSEFVPVNHGAPAVALLVNDKATKTRACGAGVPAITILESAESLLKLSDRFPLALEKISRPLADDEPMEGEGDGMGQTPPKKKKPRYDSHWRMSQIESGVASGSVFTGTILMDRSSCNAGTVNVASEGEIRVIGFRNVNRAINGDVVAIQLIDADPSITDKILLTSDDDDEGRDAVAKSDSGVQRMLSDVNVNSASAATAHCSGGTTPVSVTAGRARRVRDSSRVASVTRAAGPIETCDWASEGSTNNNEEEEKQKVSSTSERAGSSCRLKMRRSSSSNSTSRRRASDSGTGSKRSKRSSSKGQGLRRGSTTSRSSQSCGALETCSRLADSDTLDPSHAPEVSQLPLDRRDKKFGKVVGIVMRVRKEIAGTLEPSPQPAAGGVASNYLKSERIFIPRDPRLPKIAIQTRHSCHLENKRITVVLDSWDRFRRFPSGHWINVLGDVDDPNVEAEAILAQSDVVSREFSDAVIKCLPPADYTIPDEEIARRADLRDRVVCSVDPPGCKDIDDALSCTKLENGNFEVGVHIADVTHFVLPGTAIDKEASERCTTVYLVDKRTDMLPGLLTTQLCSLVANADRLAFSVIWEMTPMARVVSAKFLKSVIRSCRAFNYEEAQLLLDSKTERSPLKKALTRLNELAKKLRASRVQRGALELASMEVKFELESETRDPSDVGIYRIRDTNKLVEEFMLLANTTVAEHIYNSLPAAAILRRHPTAKEEELRELRDRLKSKGILDFKFGTSLELAQSLDAAVLKDDAFFNRCVRVLTTRCMNQAVYICAGVAGRDPATAAQIEGLTTENKNPVSSNFYHYGLAADIYTHFTSPIRRYADVLVHRLLACTLGLVPLCEIFYNNDQIAKQCDQLNVKHRNAQIASRASVEYYTYRYFRKLHSSGVSYSEVDGMVISVRENAIRVQIPRFGIEASVKMNIDEFSYDKRNHRLVSNEGVSVTVFDHVWLKIHADNSNFRCRTVVEYIRKTPKSDYATEKTALECEQYCTTLLHDPANLEAAAV